MKPTEAEESEIARKLEALSERMRGIHDDEADCDEYTAVIDGFSVEADSIIRQPTDGQRELATQIAGYAVEHLVGRVRRRALLLADALAALAEAFDDELGGQS